LYKKSPPGYFEVTCDQYRELAIRILAGDIPEFDANGFDWLKLAYEISRQTALKGLEL